MAKVKSEPVALYEGELPHIHHKWYPTYWKGMSEKDPREALECARRLKAAGYPEHAKAVCFRFRKVKPEAGPAPSVAPQGPVVGEPAKEGE